MSREKLVKFKLYKVFYSVRGKIGKRANMGLKRQRRSETLLI